MIPFLSYRGDGRQRGDYGRRRGNGGGGGGERIAVLAYIKEEGELEETEDKNSFGHFGYLINR